MAGRASRAQRGAYGRSLSPATRVFRIGVGAVVLGLVALLVSPLRGGSVGWVRDEYGHLRGSGRVDRTVLTATASPIVPGYEPARAIDDIRSTAWATAWTPPLRRSEPACGQAVAGMGAAAVLSVRFAAPLDVREIGFETGLPADNPQAGSLSRPRTVDLLWTGGGCQRVQLNASPGLQRIRVTQGRVSGVRVLIVDVDSTTVGTGRRVAIGEITFWQR